MPTDNKPAGLLDQADLDLIKENYNVEIDADDVRQYKLCQIIVHLHSQIKELTKGE